MELSIKDRIFIPQLLPQKNSFMDFNMKRNIINKVMLTSADQEKYKIVEDAKAGKITWDSEIEANEPFVVDFSTEELQYLKKACENLSETEFPDEFWLTVEKIYSAVSA